MPTLPESRSDAERSYAAARVYQQVRNVTATFRRGVQLTEYVLAWRLPSGPSQWRLMWVREGKLYATGADREKCPILYEDFDPAAAPPSPSSQEAARARLAAEFDQCYCEEMKIWEELQQSAERGARELLPAPANAEGSVAVG